MQYCVLACMTVLGAGAPTIAARFEPLKVDGPSTAMQKRAAMPGRARPSSAILPCARQRCGLIGTGSCLRHDWIPRVAADARLGAGGKLPTISHRYVPAFGVFGKPCRGCGGRTRRIGVGVHMPMSGGATPMRARLLQFGTSDEFMHEIGSQHYARQRFGLTAENIVAQVTAKLELARAA